MCAIEISEGHGDASTPAMSYLARLSFEVGLLGSHIATFCSGVNDNA
jgi:hypothetical protein